MNVYAIDLIIFFYLFVLGWILETAFKSIRDRQFVNSGFLNGPYIPLYGFGAVLVQKVLFIVAPVYLFYNFPLNNGGYSYSNRNNCCFKPRDSCHRSKSSRRYEKHYL